MDRWTEVELFTQTAELGSLSKAAEALKISNSTASRCLAALETRLGARLVERNTRRLTLTGVGESFYQRCKSILADMKEAEVAVNEAALNPSGTLRITSSLTFCMQQIVPLLSRFTQLYPNIDVQLIAANRYFDIIEAGVDVAIRTKEYESDSNMTVRKLAQTRRILVASPSYIEIHGRPESVDDLARHKLLLYSYVSKPNELHFTREGLTRVVKVRSLLEANDASILRSAALAGLGILVQSTYSIYDDVREGRLVALLEEWELPRLSINIAYQTRKHLPAKVRAFIDFMVDHFNEMDNERKWTAVGSAPP